MTLAILLVVAVALRLWGIHYGLPWLFYFHDEPQIVLRALRFGTGDLNPHFFLWPATLLLDLAFLAYVALFAVGRLAGWWTGAADFGAAYFRDPTAFYLLPRLQSVAFGTWTVWLAWELGAAAYAAPVGIAAAAGLAVNALHAHYSHLAHPVTAMTAFTTLGLLAAVRVAAGGRPRDLWLGAVATALGTACQYHAALLGAPLLVAVLRRASMESGAERRRWITRGLAAAALAGALFLVISPYVLLDYRTFRGDLAWMSAKTTGELTHATRGLLAGFVAFVRECLIPSLGMPLTLAASAGALVALWRRRAADLVLLAFVAAYLLVASRAAILNDRYGIPLVVPALLLTARALTEALTALRLDARARSWAVPVVTVLLCAPLLFTLVEMDCTMTRDDTRVEAKRWFESHVPPDARVVIDMQRFWNSGSPPLAENRERTQERLEEIRRGVSGAGHGAAYTQYYEFLLGHPRSPAYYLRSTNMGLATEPLAQYRREGFGWAIVNEDAARETRARGDPTGYYTALDREGTLVAEFRPERWRRLGPGIRIYRLTAG